jgi:hypothetical protein
MDPRDTGLYADSPERMLFFSILLLVAVALLILSNRRRGTSGAPRAAAPAELRSAEKLEPGPIAPVDLNPAPQRGPS